MPDMRRRITEDEGSLQRLLSHIPGFAGYRERQIRRKADQMVREHLVELLDDIREKLGTLIGQWARNKGMEYLDDLDRVRGRLNKVRDNIRFADYGYTGWFDAAKIKESELDSLYDYDLGLREQIAEVGGAIQALAEADEESLAQLGETALATIERLAQAVDKREEITARLVPEQGY